jgi:hypothetical protein
MVFAAVLVGVAIAIRIAIGRVSHADDGDGSGGDDR